MNSETPADAQDPAVIDSKADPRCDPVADHDLTVHDIECDVRLFSALANETRYEVLRLLDQADDEVCACELVPRLDVNQSTTSRALQALYQADLVTRRKQGRWRYYAPTSRADQLLQTVDAFREESR